MCATPRAPRVLLYSSVYNVFSSQSGCTIVNCQLALQRLTDMPRSLSIGEAFDPDTECAVCVPVCLGGGGGEVGRGSL